MEASPSAGSNSDAYRGSSRRYGLNLSPSNFIQAPLAALLEYSGILRPRSSYPETEGLVNEGGVSAALRQEDSAVVGNGGEVSIRIIGAGDHEHEHNPEYEHGHDIRRGGSCLAPRAIGGSGREGSSQNEASTLQQAAADAQAQGDDRGAEEGVTAANLSSGGVDAEAGNGAGVNSRDSSYQRYDIQQAARWIEQVLPFSLLLLVVFIRQHLQGFFVTICVTAVMFKSNDILRKQTALKGERKVSVLICISVVFMLLVVGVYWWYRNDDLLYPLVMLPPKVVPPFWHAIFIIMVNDTLVRQAAMVLKCILLIYYKNSKGRNYRKQGQMLTLIEYMLLLYRALLPTPVWYRFFLNKEYGSLFSSLMTGLYLTFKLTSVVERVQAFFAALKALSRKEVHYGAYATLEQVNAAGDLCAICQEKMHAPILLRCKHIFCEDCVSEWFERERTCPLCRALVKPADLRSFGDGSTSLFFQFY